MANKPELARIIRVFVSSPGDVREERRLLDEVVAGINDTDGITRSLRLELFRWENDVVPRIGPPPQDVVDDQSPRCDIYLGIMASRFGTPTGEHGSGTEKEFRDALEKWGACGAPWILFYFRDNPPLSHEPADIEQYLAVVKFRKEASSLGGSPVPTASREAPRTGSSRKSGCISGRSCGRLHLSGNRSAPGRTPGRPARPSSQPPTVSGSSPSAPRSSFSG